MRIRRFFQINLWEGCQNVGFWFLSNFYLISTEPKKSKVPNTWTWTNKNVQHFKMCNIKKLHAWVTLKHTDYYTSLMHKK